MTDLHPTIAELLEAERRANRPPIHALSIDAARERLRSDAGVADPPAPEVGDTADVRIDGPHGELPLRVYWPDTDAAEDADLGEPLPVLLWLHGGGYALGDLETTDSICRVLTNAVGCQVVSVDYRLAPEHPFPAGANDCYAALEWLAEHAASIGGDPDRIAVGGGSAGGGLAAATALQARDRDGPNLVHQVLVCPMTTDDPTLPARRENATGYGLTTAELEWYYDMYTPDPVAAANPYAYPLKARSLADLPTATVVTAGFDPLRDDGRRYADRLSATDVPTTYREFEDVTHSFFGLLVEPELDRARAAVELAAADLQSSFERAG